MKSKPWLPYVAPITIYVAHLPMRSSQNIIWLYPLTVIAVATVLWLFRKQYEELHSPFSTRCGSPDRADQDRPQGLPEIVRGRETHAQQANLLWAILVGVVAIAIWIGIDPYYPKLGEVAIFNASGQWVFIGIRVVGAVVVVPLMEELFWRAFLIRWLVNEDFKRVPVGTFTGLSFAVTVALFGAEHREWLAGLICGVLYNGLFYKRKDVFSCVVAHAVSNAVLAGWVLARGDWKFW